MAFFPFKLWTQEVFDGMEQRFKVLGDRHHVRFSRGQFLLWIGLLLRMAMFGLPVEKYWNWDGPASVNFMFADRMSHFVWKQWWRFICFPGDISGEDGENETVQYDRVRSFIQQLGEHWREAWNAGDYLVVDETMVFWTGQGEIHVTYLP